MISANRIRKLHPTRIVIFYRSEDGDIRYIDLDPEAFLKVIEAAEDVHADPDRQSLIQLSLAMEELDRVMHDEPWKIEGTGR